MGSERWSLKRRVLGKLLLLFLSAMVLLQFSSSVSLAGRDTLKFPFFPGAVATWGVIQGYNHGTHSSTSYQRYSLDFVRDDGQTQGQPIYAPASGSVAWGGTSSLDDQDCIAIKITDNIRVMLCHLNWHHTYQPGETITQGQLLGWVKQCVNYCPHHVHITLYYLPSGMPDYWTNRTGIPFDDAHDWPLDGVNFSADNSISNQYAGVYGLCSSQLINPSVKVDWVGTTDANNEYKNVFVRGSAIRYWAKVINNESGTVANYYYWQAFGPSSTTIFDWSGNLDDQPGEHWWYAPWPTIPTTAPEGYYTFRVRNTYGSSCRANVFRVQGGSGGQPPATPSNTSATALDSSRIRVDWDDNSNNEEGFVIHNGDWVVGTTGAFSGTGRRSFTMEGLAPSTYMCFQVQAFNAAGSSGWSNYGCTSTESEGESNLALGRPAYASSIQRGDESLFGPRNATDGNLGTRWSSRQQYEGGQDYEWIWVDLGNWYDVDKVILRWEAAYAYRYNIKVWDGYSRAWVTAYQKFGGQGGEETLAFAPKYTCCVMMEGISKTYSSWGYSLWEFEVYGSGGTGHAVWDWDAPDFCPDFMDPPGVGVEDIMLVASRWREPCGPPYNSDSDGIITVVDIMKVVARWGETCQ